MQRNMIGSNYYSYLTDGSAISPVKLRRSTPGTRAWPVSLGNQQHLGTLSLTSMPTSPLDPTTLSSCYRNSARIRGWVSQAHHLWKITTGWTSTVTRTGSQIQCMSLEPVRCFVNNALQRWAVTPR